MNFNEISEKVILEIFHKLSKNERIMLSFFCKREMKIFFFNKENVEAWKRMVSSDKNIAFPSISTFIISPSGGSYDSELKSNGEVCGHYYVHNGGLVAFEYKGVNVDVEKIEELYVKTYNKIYNTSHMTQREYAESIR